MNKVRITAIRQTIYSDLVSEYENPIEHTCDVREGQQWISVDGKCPDGMCPSAWNSMKEFVESLARGEGNFYDGWMKNPMSAMISCNDGFRPFSFYLEAICEEQKAERMEKLFDSIADDYDRLNHLLSLGTDRSWRRRALKSIVEPGKVQEILDVACGTGDFSIDIALAAAAGSTVTGLNISEGMLAVMREKVAGKGLKDSVRIMKGNGESLSFPDASFDRVTIAFGIRNFGNRELALREMLRVLRPGGRLVILELSVPESPVTRWAYNLYFKHVLPLVGGIISGDMAAYRYLPASVLKFPGRREWIATMESCGFREVTHKAFTLGICRMYTGTK